MKILIISPFIIVLTIIGSIFFGTFSESKDFGYDDSDKIFSWGAVHARLIGTDRKIGSSDNLREKPYNLYISVTLNDKFLPASDCILKITGLKLISRNKGEIVFSKSDDNSSFSLQNGVYKSLFSYQNLDINYIDYDLEFIISNNNCSEHFTTEDLKIPLSMRFSKSETSLANQ